MGFSTTSRQSQLSSEQLGLSQNHLAQLTTECRWIYCCWCLLMEPDNCSHRDPWSYCWSTLKMIMPPQVESSLVGLSVNLATKGRAAAHVGSSLPHLLAYKNKPHILGSLIKRCVWWWKLGCDKRVWNGVRRCRVNVSEHRIFPLLLIRAQRGWIKAPDPRVRSGLILLPLMQSNSWYQLVTLCGCIRVSDLQSNGGTNCTEVNSFLRVWHSARTHTALLESTS